MIEKESFVKWRCRECQQENCAPQAERMLCMRCGCVRDSEVTQKVSLYEVKPWLKPRQESKRVEAEGLPQVAGRQQIEESEEQLKEKAREDDAEEDERKRLQTMICEKEIRLLQILGIFLLVIVVGMQLTLSVKVGQ